MSHARIEEVSDSDEVSDPSEGDIEDFDEREILKQRPSQIQHPSANPSSSLISPGDIPSVGGNARSNVDADGTRFESAIDASKYNDFQCIYPIYFDKNRSRQEGRRVGLELAVENPMAREVVTACAKLRLETLFEPAKCHPKDWANPGRVKVKLKGGNNPSVKNKHHLYLLISKHLQENPTTEETSLKVRVPGVPPPDPKQPYPKPAITKGNRWKIGTVLPYYSPALTGGGVSENFFKDMMAEMQAGGGGLPGAMPGMLEGMAGGSGASGSGGNGDQKKAKDKKKKIKG